MEDCVFCKITKDEVPSWKVYEDGTVTAFLDINPTNIGHTVVIPNKHFESFLKTPDDELAKLMSATKKIAQAVKNGVLADGVNIMINNDRAAGQIIFHTHIHIVPRFVEDGFKHWRGKRQYKEGEQDEVVGKIRAHLT
ncbi:HIT family protein [Candidatus Parcubacteria bacterium]|nr:HIT family protein [Candidatus Parcubacteria bacterium]